MSRKRIRWTPEKIQEISDLYQVMTARELAIHYKWKIGYCMNIIKRFKLRKDTSVWDESDEYLVVGLEIEQVPRKVIADKMERSVGSVYRLIQRLKHSGKYYQLFARYIEENNHRLRR